MFDGSRNGDDNVMRMISESLMNSAIRTQTREHGDTCTDTVTVHRHISFGQNLFNWL